jgi:hypothetical protein
LSRRYGVGYFQVSMSQEICFPLAEERVSMNLLSSEHLGYIGPIMVKLLPSVHRVGSSMSHQVTVLYMGCFRRFVTPKVH